MLIPNSASIISAVQLYLAWIVIKHTEVMMSEIEAISGVLMNGKGVLIAPNTAGDYKLQLSIPIYPMLNIAL